MAISASTADLHDLTGTGSAFTSELQIGDVIESSSNQYIVTTVTDDTNAIVYSHKVLMLYN